MDGFSILDQRSWRPELYADTSEYKAGHAFGWLYRGNKQAAMNYPLSGRLYCAKSGWLLLSVPNALVRGVFDALSAPGTELPLAGVMNVPNVDADVLNAHISVMNADEVSSIGCDKINERGHMFSYRLGGMKEINVKNVDGVSKVWAIQVYSPELTALRKSYGLSPLMNGDHAFHITVAVRRKRVLQANDVSKAAAAAPWATFVVAPHEKGYAATTRPTGDGKFGLPGGKLEPGEDPLAAVQREAQEEGWRVSDVHPKPLYKSEVDGKPVWWYRARAAQMLNDFKEKGRVTPTTAQQEQLTEFGNDVALKKYLAATRISPDLTKLAPKWRERDHILAALPKHLTDTQTAITSGGNVDKEMTDLALIANAWLRSQQQKELLAARLKKFKETAGYPSLAATKVAADSPQPRVRVVMPYKNQYLMETLNNSKWPQNIGKRRFMGGGIEAGETPAQAAAREMFEELGVKIKPTAFRPLGNDPREGWQHEHYLELLKHKLKPGNFNATVGSDAVVTLSHGLPEGDDYMGPDIKKLLAPAVNKAATAELSRAGQKDLLPGGKADNLPDREFSPAALAEGSKHEHEHTSNDQTAKEIAKDHLSEDKSYYEKIKEIEKRGISAHKDVLAQLLQAKAHSDNKRYAEKTQILRRLMAQSPQDWVIDDPKPHHKGVTHKPTRFRLHTDPSAIPPTVKAAENVYMNQLRNMYSMRRPIVYDYNKPVFENIRDQAMEVKRRGDFMINARRNHQQYMSALSPQYRYQLAIKAMRGELEEPDPVEQAIHNYGDHFLNMAMGRPK